MLHFEGAWRFDSPGPIPAAVVNACSDLINKIVVQGDRRQLLEHFKSYFSGAAGTPHYPSSDSGWAATDLAHLMDEAAQNAPLFIEAFHNACAALSQSHPEIGLPDVPRVNRILIENEAGYQIELPNLIATKTQSRIAVPDKPLSLDAQAQEIVQTSIQASDKLLAEGQNRQAVQEVLWLLETVATGFRGVELKDGSVQGKYFNKIIAEMRAGNRGKNVHQILGWMQTLHGFLSSPTGGGIRHGVDLKEGIAVQAGEARLLCNLIKSYIGFLIAEHERLNR
jgi:hypothetical protein